MDNLKCPLCNKKANEPINLRCEHHPCFQCASQIIRQSSTLQTRYRIVCPLCHKKTITYDLRHLIINATEQDQDLFVTSKFVNKKPEVVAKRTHNADTDKVGGHIKRNSFQGVINICGPSKSISLQCKKHSGCNIQYFCAQCCERNNIDVFMCNECLKNHKHRVINVREAAQIIQAKNQNRREMIPARRKYLQETLTTLVERKQIMNNQFQNLYKQIADEFKVLYHYINEQYELIKKQVKSIYAKQSEQIRNSITFAQRLRQNLIGLQKISTQNRSEIETQVNYSICLSDIEFAIQAGKSKLNERFEIPKILKKTSAILSSTQKLFQIQSHKTRPASKATTPTNSARAINYHIQPNRMSRHEQRQSGPDISILKENFYPLSPKNYLCTSKLNI